MALSKSEFEAMYRDLEIPLYNFALRWVFHAALAEELVHDAFARIWHKRDAVEPSTLKGLLYKTVQNLAINENRRRRVREALPLASWIVGDPPQADQDLERRQELARMRAALERLPNELREVLLLAQFSDLNYQQIAATLGIPEGTVASRKNRALHALRNDMQGEKDDGLDQEIHA